MSTPKDRGSSSKLLNIFFNFTDANGRRNKGGDERLKLSMKGINKRKILYKTTIYNVSVLYLLQIFSRVKILFLKSWAECVGFLLWSKCFFCQFVYRPVRGFVLVFLSPLSYFALSLGEF